MAEAKPPLTVLDRDPRVGDCLVFEKRRWDVTDHSIHNTPEGYVQEWCCEQSYTEAYLLKELNKDGVDWFFTRWQPFSRIAVQGKSLTAWARGQRDPQPPPEITFNGTRFLFKERIVGTYEEDPGDSEEKVTWEYWDAAEEKNVAIEVWQNGDMDVYQGAYVEGERLKIDAAAMHRGMSVEDVREHPFMMVGILTAGLFFMGFLAEAPAFDQIMAFALAGAFLGAAVLAAWHFPVVGGTSFGLAILMLFVYKWFPPLTTVIGAAASLACPVALSRLARRSGDIEPGRVRFLAGFSVGLPALVQGLFRYFNYAPAPHTFGLMLAAVVPAMVVGTVGYALAAWLARPKSEGGPPSLIS
jgi:hypothetical protein